MSLKLLIKQRSTVRSAVTRQYNDINNYSTYTVTHRANLVMTINGYKSKLDDLDDKICKLKFAEDASLEGDDFQIEFDECEGYSDRIHECLSELSGLEGTDGSPANNGSNGGQAGTHAPPAQSLLRCPTAPLPKYTSSEGENFELFLEQFEDTISKFNHPSYDKFLLLKQQISGKALYLIDSLEPQRQTYEEAKTLLTKALASREIQVFNVVKQMHDLKLPYSGEPFQYIAQIKKIINAFRYLKITANDILQYFVLLGMNESFRKCLVMITNDNHPSLDAILDNFFKTNERYSIEQEKFKSKSKTEYRSKSSTYSASMTASKFEDTANPFRICTLCPKNNDHPINKCIKYPNARNKLERLKAINGCCVCASNDHCTSNCNFKLRRVCSNCSLSHFTFLCPTLPDKTTMKNTSSNAAVTLNMQSLDNFDCIVPTFSCFVGNGLSELRLRGLKDTGSQSNLICESLLVSIDHDVVNPAVTLQINGINDAKIYMSKLINVSIRLGDSNYVVPFLTIPSINTSMRLPGLSGVVSDYQSKGYQLADEELSDDSDYVSNIQLILGSGSAYCFKYFTVHYGSSVFYQTQFGVMLDGSVPQMKNDISKLPDNKPIETFSAALKVCDTSATQSLIPKFKNVEFSMNLLDSKSITGQHLIDCKDLPIIANYKCNDYSGKATDNELNDSCNDYLNVDDVSYNDSSVDIDSELVKFLLGNCTRKEDGRIVMPLLWNERVKHLLAQNYNLSKSILFGNLKKLKNDELKIGMIDDNIKTLLNMGIIEPVSDIEQFIELNPTCSFLAHMPIFKMEKETTKCRNVFMSNLAEKCRDGRTALSHNQCMYAGPNLNAKLATALLQLRFNENLLTFDICKAFLQIELLPHDANKLLFLWHKDIKNNDYSVQAYRNLRLSFGLRCSPCILMVSLYKMLVVDAVNDDYELKKLKEQIYSNIYMDNGCISFNSVDQLTWAYDRLGDIFSDYQFKLQQFCCNVPQLREKIDQHESDVALFGLLWNTDRDSLRIKPCVPDQTADTPRKVLKTLAEVFDPCSFELPLYNRAKLFLHKLQSQGMKWDCRVTDDQGREWTNICKQLNDSPPIEVQRYIGKSDSNYEILCFTDSSGYIYGCVIYLREKSTGRISFITAKNHVVGKALRSQTIPSLEFNAIVLGTEVSLAVRNDLAGTNVVSPVNIDEVTVFSDSLVSLNWINSAVNDLAKLNKLRIFVKNRLNYLMKLCDTHPVTFTFVDGIQNPADLTTRVVSPRKFVSSNYFTGPSFLGGGSEGISRDDILRVTVPGIHQTCGLTVGSAAVSNVVFPSNHLFSIDRFSSYTKILNIYKYVLKFVSILKTRISNRRSGNDANDNNINIHQDSTNLLISIDQAIHFPELILYFANSSCPNNQIPHIVTQLNLYMDNNNILRVSSKISHKAFSNNNHRLFPIFLSKTSRLTELLIWHLHEKLLHAGVYATLSEFRQSFWVCSGFSTVKRVLQNCIVCKRFNSRTMKINQSDYKDWRISPSDIPYSDIFIDHMGPFKVKQDNEKVKVWVLVVTCLFSRAINLKICKNLSTNEFLRAFQLHTFEWGLPQRVFSDLGSSIVAGAETIASMFNDHVSAAYFEENNIKAPEFTQYYKGCSSLGSMVEICVKLTKRLIYASIKTNVLSFADFEFVICEVVHIVNRRPIAFKDDLRNFSGMEIISPITPEILLHGYQLPSANIIPAIEVTTDPDVEYDPVAKVADTALKLRKVRGNLKETYNEQFVPQLIDQATNRKSRYKPVKHEGLSVHDIVLIKEDNCKPIQYPLAIVKELKINEAEEVVGAVLLKGATGELVKRHSSVIIPLLRCGQETGDISESGGHAVEVEETPQRTVNRRKAAIAGELKTREMLAD